MANRNYPKNSTATTVIPFDNPVTYIPPKTVTGAVTFTKNTASAQAGYTAIIRVIANGTNVPDLSAFKSIGTGTYDNTNGVVNQLWFVYDGTDYCVAITHPIAISGGGLTQLSTPAAFTATPSGSSVNLSWSDVSNETGYKVYWNAINDFGSAALATTTAANAGTYTKTGLSNGPWYFWVVAVGDGVTYSDSNPASASATVSSGATALNAPAGVTLGTATSSTQPLTWTDTNSSPNENGYKVYYNTVNTFGSATLATTTAANGTSYTVTGLSASTLYYYWVVAQGNGTTTADSSASTVASGSTSGATGSYLAITTGNLTESPTGTWNSASAGGTGVSTLALAGDGYIEMQYLNATTNNKICLGLDNDSSNEFYTSWKWGIVPIGSAYYMIENGTAATTVGGTPTVGDVVRVVRTGSTLTLVINGATVHTFTDTSAASLTGKLECLDAATKASEVKGLGFA
jgi:hypothetical protein